MQLLDGGAVDADLLCRIRIWIRFAGTQAEVSSLGERAIERDVEANAGEGFRAGTGGCEVDVDSQGACRRNCVGCCGVEAPGKNGRGEVGGGC